MRKKPLNYKVAFTENFNVKNAEVECKKAYELLRRVYDIVEMSHLNDHKLSADFCKEFKFPRILADDIFNCLQSKSNIFRQTNMRRQKNFRLRIKNRKRKEKKIN